MPPDGRLVRGDATRRVVLRRAVDIASVEGLDGLSIGRLATELELSKSGVFAHFGSKESLQLASIQAASEIFTEQVVTPALAAPPGLARLWKLCETWLEYSERRIFPGGCFFFNTAAEFDARSGPVHDAIAEYTRKWQDLLTRLVAEAAQLGHLASGVEAAQLAFEIDALARTANAHSVLHGGNEPYRRARRGILGRLRAEAVEPDLLPPAGKERRG
ncbi:TetR/AcrR family transcriptional regulator [Amycolatopsis anabasis]|uniref:TetR/AcrR family transcriptional regulator n=1 Tax=Amycolatopsis anabasis TaxID=1840409 RepID=UPI00131B8520|nr:TetR/AcrR family transcriptional regulator [Amycolatopsis anabasis]